jgi:hypothetical protein
MLILDPIPFRVVTAIAELKMYKTSCSDQILAEPIQAGGKILRAEIHKFINSIWNKDEFPDQ